MSIDELTDDQLTDHISALLLNYLSACTSKLMRTHPELHGNDKSDERIYFTTEVITLGAEIIEKHLVPELNRKFLGELAK